MQGTQTLGEADQNMLRNMALGFGQSKLYGRAEAHRGGLHVRRGQMLERQGISSGGQGGLMGGISASGKFIAGVV